MIIKKKGRILFLFILLFGGWLSLLKGAFGEEDKLQKEANEIAKVTFLQGKAEVQSKREVSWSLLRVGSLLYPEDEVRTFEKSRIEIQFPDRSILRFDERTTFQIKKAFFEATTNSREIKIEMILGKSWANVRKIFGSKKTFEVAAANAVAGVRDTIWRMNVEADKTTLIRVYEGVVQVYNPFIQPEYRPEKEGFKTPQEVTGPKEIPPPYHEVSREEWEEIVLKQMMQVRIPPVGKPEKPTRFSLEEDRKEEWVRWNQRRDRELRIRK